MNKNNYEKNIEKFHSDARIVTLAIDRDGKVMSKTSETEIAEQTRKAAADVSENTQTMEKILDRLEEISNDFNQSIEYNEKIVNEYNRILEDINYISDIDPDKIYQFLAGINNNDIESGVEFLINIIKSQIDKESEPVEEAVKESEPVEEAVKESEPVGKAVKEAVKEEVEEEVDEPLPESIEKYSYAFIGSGYCDQTASGAEITLLNNNKCFRGSSTDSVQKCAEKCNNNNECDNISFLSAQNEHYCCLYEDEYDNCTLGANGIGSGFNSLPLDTFWGKFQTYIKTNNCDNYNTAFKTVRYNNAGDTTNTNHTCEDKLKLYKDNHPTDMTDEERINTVMYIDPVTPGCLPIGCESLNQRN